MNIPDLLATSSRHKCYGQDPDIKAAEEPSNPEILNVEPSTSPNSTLGFMVQGLGLRAYRVYRAYRV